MRFSSVCPLTWITSNQIFLLSEKVVKPLLPFGPMMGNPENSLYRINDLPEPRYGLRQVLETGSGSKRMIFTWLIRRKGGSGRSDHSVQTIQGHGWFLAPDCLERYRTLPIGMNPVHAIIPVVWQRLPSLKISFAQSTSP